VIGYVLAPWVRGVLLMWAVFYWVSSLFLYVAAIAPLTPLPEGAQEFLGFLEGLVIFFGILMFRSKSLHRAVVNASMRIDAKSALVMNLLSTISLLILIFILCAYYMKWKKVGDAWLYMNWIGSPFAMFFFLLGKWCVFRIGSTYKKRDREKNG
jgi:hypothetical protein